MPGSSDDTAGGPDASSDAGAASSTSLAGGLLESGKLSVSCAFDSVPYAGESGSAKAGYAFELVQAIADELGLELVWEDVGDDAAALARAGAQGERVVGGAYERSDVALATTGLGAALSVDGASVALGDASGAGDVDGASGDAGAAGDAADAAGTTDTQNSSQQAQGALAQGKAYLETPLCLVARKAADVDAQTLPSQTGARIGVVEGSPAEAFAARELASCELVSYATPTELFSAVQAANVEAAVADEAQASYHLRVSYGDEHIVTTYENALASYFLVCDAGKTALGDALGQALASLEEKGAAAELYAAWFEQGEKERGTSDARTPEQGAPTHDKGGGA